MDVKGYVIAHVFTCIIDLILNKSNNSNELVFLLRSRKVVNTVIVSPRIAEFAAFLTARMHVGGGIVYHIIRDSV